MSVLLATSVAQALVDAQAHGLERSDAHGLLAHHLQRSRAWLIAHDEALLPAAIAAAFAADCQRRAQGEPLAYLVGEREFHGLGLRVTPDVLVPRPDTETLVDWALECIAGSSAPGLDILDLGTGSGAIILALAHALRLAPGPRQPILRFTATDLSSAALAVAQGNGLRHGLQIEWAQGAWWTALAGERRFDLVLSNPPYIRQGDPHLRALRHEPALALTSGADGLDALREIIQRAPQRLHPGGRLMLEHGWDQAPAVRALLTTAGFTDIETRRDIEARPRCSAGLWRNP